MNTDLIVFYSLALIAVASAAAMLVSKNTVYSALFLVLNFATIAVFYLILGAPFIAMAQVTVYAGAIMVLFLFVIMLLGVEKIAGEDKLIWQKPFAAVLVVLFAFDLYYLFAISGITDGFVRNMPADFGSPGEIGLVLFRQYMLPLQVTAVLLLVAMVGAVVLTKTGRFPLRLLGSKKSQEESAASEAAGQG